MALTLYKEPPAISLSENDIELGVQQTGVELVKNLANFSVTAIPANNDSFRFYSDLFDVTFTFKTTPDTSGLQLRCDFADVEDFQAALLEDIAKNFDIFSNCEIVEHLNDPGDVAGVNIVAKNYGNFNFGAELIVCSVGSVYANTPTSIAENYFIGCIIGTNSEKLIPDSSRQALFNLKKMWDNAGGFTWPEANTTPVAWANFCKLHNIKYFEIINNIPQVLTNYPIRVLQGGIDRKALAYLADESSNWYTHFSTNKKFLTWSPAQRIIDPSQSLKLYYLPLGTSLYTVKILFATGEDPVEINFIGTQYKVYELILTPAKIFDVETLPTVSHFRVWIVDQANPEVAVSEEKEYFIDWNYYEFRREFIFSNSYIGAYENIIFTGRSDENIELENTLFSRMVSDATLKQLQQSRSLILETFKTSTGWLPSRLMLYWMQEFLHSEDRYEVIGGRIYPIYFVSSKLTRRSDGEDMFYLEIEYARSWKEEFYSDILEAQGVSYTAGATGSLPEYNTGHIIVDRDGTLLPKRKKLKFIGPGVVVTDDEINDQTIVDIANGGLRHAISLSHINTTPTSTATIVALIDLRTAVTIGDVLEITQDGTTKQYFVQSITANLITVLGNVLSTEDEITMIRFMRLTGTTLEQKVFTLNKDNWVNYINDNFAQEITVPGINLMSFAIVSPDQGAANQLAYATARITGGVQAQNKITIECETEPTVNIYVLISWLWQ